MGFTINIIYWIPVPLCVNYRNVCKTYNKYKVAQSDTFTQNLLPHQSGVFDECHQEDSQSKKRGKGLSQVCDDVTTKIHWPSKNGKGQHLLCSCFMNSAQPCTYLY